MASEEGLVKRFNEIIEEMRRLCQPHFNQNFSTWSIQDYGVRENFYKNSRQKIDELESLGIEKVKLEQAIQRILQKVEQDIRKVLANTQLTETERRIKVQLEKMKRYIADGREPDIIRQEALDDLVRLEVSEQDLIKARERILQVTERLVKVAEKLE